MYIVAFNRDRDSYQVPLALAEAGQLESLITDCFFPEWTGSLPKVGRRTCRGLPWRRVRWSPRALLLQLWDLARAETDLERQVVFGAIDQALSRQAGRQACASGADLLLYSGYALEAFRKSERRKTLFVYHPHGHGTDDLLREDFARFPEIVTSHQWHMFESQNLDSNRLEAELDLATDVLCASAFTLSTLPERHRVRPYAVVPYGCHVPTIEAPVRAPGRTRYLFVGQGVQRKGLHHLLRVWQDFLTETNAELNLVIGRCDPWLAGEVARQALPHASGLSTASLAEAFDHADVLVLPSLVEGFGLVLLEALARGCHVIATTNTGLPDLGLPDWAGQVVAPGDLADLRRALLRADEVVQSGGCSRTDVRELARQYSWARFRSGIRTAMGIELTKPVQ